MCFSSNLFDWSWWSQSWRLVASRETHKCSWQVDSHRIGGHTYSQVRRMNIEHWLRSYFTKVQINMYEQCSVPIVNTNEIVKHIRFFFLQCALFVVVRNTHVEKWMLLSPNYLLEIRHLWHKHSAMKCGTVVRIFFSIDLTVIASFILWSYPNGWLYL